MYISNANSVSRYADKLEALGMDGENGLEQFTYMAQVAGIELANFLNVDIGELVESVNSSMGSINRVSAANEDLIRNAVYTLGAEVERVTPPSYALPFAVPTAPPPAQVNMVADMPDIRDQEDRGTCVAHAAVAAFEHHLNVRGAYQDLSEQFLYWNCKQNDGIPNISGTWLEKAFPLLNRDGCCLEETWPYNPQPIVGNEGQGPPPNGAQFQALSYRVANFRRISPTSVADIKNELAAGRCVAFSVPVYNSWLRSYWVGDTGDITMPVPFEIRAGGHAMCMVGYVDLPNRPGLGGGRFILRNSWGRNWGINSPYGAGYGTIPYAYIARLGSEAYSIL